MRGIALGSLGLVPLTRVAAAQTAGDRYVVGTSTRAGAQAAQAAAQSAGPILDFGRFGQAVAGRFTSAALAGLSQRSDLRYIESDYPVYAVSTVNEYEEAWGVGRVGAKAAHDAGETGAGAHIAIIDTGIMPGHEDLTNLSTAGAAFVNGDGTLTGDTVDHWKDDNGHGTHCAGTAGAVRNGFGVVGTGPDVTLHAVKVLKSNGSGTSSDVAAGITYTAEKGWHVASLSLGSRFASTVIHDACKYANIKGVLLVAAAGNDGPANNTVSYPAAYPEVIAVSATTKSDKLARWSSRGPEVDLAAPGASITSTTFDGDYGGKSGTSMACPHVSGAGAVLMAMTDYNTNEKARQRLFETAEDIGLSANEQGRGLLNMKKAVLGDNGGTGDPATLSILGANLRETSGKGPNAAFTVDWTATGSNLSSVTAELFDESRTTLLNSLTTAVSGSEASGSSTLQAKGENGRAKTFLMVLTATDGAENTSEPWSGTITENGTR